MRRTEAQYAEQRAAVYELRVRGLTYAEISTNLNVPISTLHRWVQDLVAARVSETQSEMLAFELDRLDRYSAKLEEQIEAGKQVARNTEVILRVSERRAKLLGLDAATQVEAVVHQVDAQDLAIAELVREAQAAAAVEEQRVTEQSV